MKQISWKYPTILLICLLGCRPVLAADSPATSRVFTVEEAVQHALESDLTLKKSSQDVEIARKQLANTEKTISLSGGIGQKEIRNSINKVEGRTINARLTLNPQWSITADHDEANNNLRGLGISYAPFELKKLSATKEMEAQLASKVSDYELTKVRLIRDVRNAYAEVIQKKRLLECSRANLSLAREHCKHVQSRFNLGKVLEIDLTEAKQQVKTAEVEVTSAELDLARSLLKLNKLTGLTLPSHFNLDDTSLNRGNPEQIDFEATRKHCLANSPELHAAELAIQYYQLQLKITKRQWASGWNINLLRQWEDYNTVYNDDVNKTIALTLSGSPIYDQSRKGQKEIAALTLEKSKQSKEDITLQTAKNLEEAYKSWQIAHLSLQPKMEGINLAKEKLRIMTLKFDMGLASAADLNEARGTLLQKEQSYWNAWLELQNAREQFYYLAWGLIKSK